MTPERRAGGEVRIAGRTLSGTAMRYGDVSPDFRERFEPGAFGDVRAVDLNLQHDPAVVVARGASLTDSPVALSVSATLPEGAAALALVRRRALNGYSIEFTPTRERRDAAGVRVVEAATLTGLALVDRGAYPGATAEVRARSGRTMRSRIPVDRAVDCACADGGCSRSEILGEAMETMWKETFEEGTKRVAAAYLENYSTPIASTARGTLRGRITGIGGYEVDMDIPDSAAGRSLIDAWESSGIIVRPFIDNIESEIVAGVQRIHGGRLRAFILTATDQRDGWPDPEMVPTPEDLVQRAAPVARRRLWL